MSQKILIALVVLFTANRAFGQTASDAIITGTVVDSAQGVVEGAAVTVTDVATGVVTNIATNSQGEYRTPPLKIGSYDVTIERAGFKQYKISGLVLDIGSVRQVNATLALGRVVESVEVKASAEQLLQKSDSTVGTVITNRQIEDLPLNGGSSGRDYLQLAALSAGTTASSQGVSIGGQAGTSAAFLLDGVDNNNQQISTGHSGQKEIIKPSVDAVSEFRVVTNSYSAEYGRSASGVVSVDLKSGTNNIHGTAYEFLRNDALDAVNYFSTSKLPFKYNDFGGTLGGPIRKNRVFAFGDLEFFRLRQQSPSYSLVPTAAQRSGKFSTTIYDPNGAYNATTESRTATFANNQITEIDPVAQALLKYFPLPNFTPTPTVPKANYLYNQSSNANNYRWDVRVDEVLTARQSLFERFSSQQTRDGVVATLPPIDGQYYAGGGANTTDSRAFVVGYNTSFSPTLLASARASWNRLYWHNFFPDQSLTSAGVPGVETLYPGFSEILISNFATIGVSNVPNIDESVNRELEADLTWIHGAHTLKFGLQEFWLQTNFNSSQRSSGIFSFNGEYTSQKAKSSSSPDQNFADFLLGAASKEQLSSTAILNFRTPYTHLYVQDDWKASRTLTLNAGLRYEISPPAVDKFDGIANLDLDSDPTAPHLIRAGQFGDSINQRALQNVSYTGLAPRVGFAFSPQNSKTVLRGGVGIFYANLITLGGMQSMEINPPASPPRVTISPSPVIPSSFLHNGFAAGTLSFTNGKNVELASYDRHARVPTDLQWNLNVQRALPFGVVAEVGYYANKLDHNWWQVDGNPAPPIANAALPAGGINANRRFQTTSIPVAGNPTITLADIIRIGKAGWSEYNGLQVKVEKRYENGLSVLASYTYSKSLGIGDTAGIQDQANIAAEKSVTNTDQRHHFVGSAVYSLPFGRGQKFGSTWNRWIDGALGGWSVSPIVTLSSGMPLNLAEAGNPSNTGGTADRPRLVGNPLVGGVVAGNTGTPGCGPNSPAGNGYLAGSSALAPAQVHTHAAWFNPCAFEVQSSGTYGNTPRNFIVSPGTVNLDAAIHKTIAITEHLKAQLRLESFNVTNTPHFGSPGLDSGSVNSFGVIATAASPRQNQLAVKFLF
ncbi:MAG TPA: carboxypeptidase regulatory-like domain-containing protein [Acidobacteriaceae bacterium]|nr:carboxypeptidase regulatory-like domain-containing protein [Acidobacteriaceae bacterium]